MSYAILMHEANDDVGVAVTDLTAGSQVEAVTLEGQLVATLTILEEVPLGHKVALREIAPFQEVVEYGRAIGRATRPIRRGEHVHVHNLRSLRWSRGEP